MTDTQDAIARAEALARGKQDPQLTEKAPPRPSDMPSTPSKERAPVSAGLSVHTDARDKVHVEIDTHEAGARGGAAGGWPKGPEDWKCLLAKAAPWLAAAAIVAVSARSYASREGGEAAGHKARRLRDRASDAAEDAADHVKRGWFGLKHRTEDTADTVGDNVHDAKRAAARKADEAKGAVKGAANRTVDAARDKADAAKHAAGRAADAAKHGASDVAHGVKVGAEGAADAAKDKAEQGFFLWKSATAGVKEGYFRAKDEVGHVAGEAADSVKHGAHNVAAGARHAASATGHAAHDAKEWTKEKAGDAVDAARRAEHAAEDVAYRGFSKGVAEAGAAEESTGKAMRKAGERIEQSGRDTKHYYRGETEKPKRKRFLGIF